MQIVFTFEKSIKTSKSFDFYPHLNTFSLQFGEMSEPCSDTYLVLAPYCSKNIVLLGRNSREPDLMECAQEVCYYDGEEALDDDKVS